jgi:hypothetical protein
MSYCVKDCCYTTATLYDNDVREGSHGRVPILRHERTAFTLMQLI